MSEFSAFQNEDFLTWWSKQIIALSLFRKSNDAWIQWMQELWTLEGEYGHKRPRK